MQDVDVVLLNEEELSQLKEQIIEFVRRTSAIHR